MRRKISILGSTGSIGRQALEVIDKLKDKFEIIALTAGNNTDLLNEQIKKFKPKYAYASDINSICGAEPLSIDEVKEQVEWIEEFYNEVKSDFKDYDTKELACLLENYSFFKASTTNGNIIATTSSDNITFYPYYYLY